MDSDATALMLPRPVHCTQCLARATHSFWVEQQMQFCASNVCTDCMTVLGLTFIFIYESMSPQCSHALCPIYLVDETNHLNYCISTIFSSDCVNSFASIDSNQFSLFYLRFYPFIFIVLSYIIVLLLLYHYYLIILIKSKFIKLIYIFCFNHYYHHRCHVCYQF